ncbi:MAG: hypothetical protein ABI551_19590 [Polyangiaceae bacterium]
MYADPRPLFIVVGVVMFSLAIWVSYVLLAMRQPWPLPVLKASKPSDDPPA